MSDWQEQSSAYPWQHRRTYETAFAELQCDAAWAKEFNEKVDGHPPDFPISPEEEELTIYPGIVCIATPADSRAEAVVADGLFTDVLRQAGITS